MSRSSRGSSPTVNLFLTLTPTRKVEAFSCGQGHVRLDVWYRTATNQPWHRLWVILSAEEWRKLRRLSPRRSR